VNRKIILLNVVLVALAGWLIWMLRAKWVELHSHEHVVLASSPRTPNTPIPPPIPGAHALSASDYSEVAQRTLFSRDRNPNVAIELPPPPPPPPPAPKMPELPAYYGEIGFGDPTVLLRLPKESQQSYHKGEKVGPFVLVSFNSDKIVFDWDGKLVERKPDELREKESVQEVAVARQQAVAAPAPVNNGGGFKQVGGAAEGPKLDPKIGADNGGGIHQCVTGEKSPPGTIVDGFKKLITTNMFGETCMWVAVNP
jgi:hypothetical protein